MSAHRVAVLLLGIEGALAAYLALMAWTLSSWMVDDAVASRLTTAGWYWSAAQRFGLVVLVSAAFTWLASMANDRWLFRAPGEGGRAMGRLAIVLGGLVLLAGLAGSVQFVWRKPFM